MSSAFAEFSAIYVHETHSAILVDAGLKENLWIPKSVTRDFDEYSHSEGDTFEISVQEWFAEKKDLF